MLEFTISSTLNIPPARLWELLSMNGVNWELAPVIRMTVSGKWRFLPLAEWEPGHPLFKSWILLFGLIPVDRHTMCLAGLHQGVGFHEHSFSIINRQWNHTRTIAPSGRGCVLTDCVAVEGRMPFLTRCLFPIYQRIFHHRHRRLQNRYPKRDECKHFLTRRK